MATVAERGEVGTSLAEQEAIIERGARSFVEVGNASRRIRSERLYEPEFATFEEYVQGRWGFEKSWIYWQIGAAQVSTLVESRGLPAPRNEQVARQLVKPMNEAGGLGPGMREMLYPERAGEMVVTLWQKVLDAKAQSENPDTPITGAFAARVINPPPNDGRPGWFELLGLVGDGLIVVRQRLGTVEEALNRQPNAKFRAKAGEYATWGEEIASRLRAIEG